MKKNKDKFLGCLVGLAIGDALGMPIEFKSPFKPVVGMRKGTHHNLPAGYWTDDTSMALCLADSLVRKKGFDPQDQLRTYVKWYKKGHLSADNKCDGIGSTTREALNKFQKTKKPYCGTKDGAKAGNGSIMRLAPIPMFYFNNRRDVIKYSALSAKTTHGAKVCVDATKLLGVMIQKALKGSSKEDILNTHLPNLEPLVNTIIENKNYKLDPPYIKGTGFVVKSLEAALWAFNKTNNYKDCVLAAVNLGDDADTTGAIAGALAGAYYGYDSIPTKWKNKLTKKDLIEGYALKLLK